MQARIKRFVSFFAQKVPIFGALNLCLNFFHLVTDRDGDLHCLRYLHLQPGLLGLRALTRGGGHPRAWQLRSREQREAQSALLYR